MASCLAWEPPCAQVQMVSKQLAEQPCMTLNSRSFLAALRPDCQSSARQTHVEYACYDKVLLLKFSIQQMSAHYWC